MRYWPIFCLALAGCNAPEFDFRGVDPVRMSLGGSTFDIRVKGARAEAIRVNSQYAPRLATVGPQAVLAIEKVSGCKVARLDGDAAMMWAALSCDGRPAPLSARARHYDCEIAVVYDGFADLDCVPSTKPGP